MSERPRPDDRDPVRDLRRLGRFAPDRQRSAAAVRRALDRVTDRSDGNETNRDRSQLWTRRRLMMASGIAATIAAAVVLIGISITGEEVQATALLQKAIEKQQTYDGWFRVERFEKGEWKRIVRCHPRKGVSLNWLGEGFDNRIEYVNRHNNTYAKYEPSLKKLFVTDYVKGMAIREVYPTTGAGVSELIQRFGTWKSKKVERDHKMRLIFTRTATSPGISERGRKHVPRQFICEIDSDTGLLLKASMRPGKGEDLRPLLRYTYGVHGSPSFKDVPIPEGAKIVDNRPTGKARRILDRIDKIVRNGSGLKTAYLIEQSRDGTVARLEIFTRRGDRWLAGWWDLETSVQSDTISNWEAALKAVKGKMPGRVWVFNGQTLWFFDDGADPGEQETDPTWEREAAPSIEAYAYRGLPGELWWGRHRLLANSSNPAKMTFDTRPDPDNPHGVILTASQYNKYSSHEELVRDNVKAISYATDSGMMPHWRTNTYGIDRTDDGEVIFKTMRIDFSPAHTVMLKEPIRIPTRWKREIESDNPTLPMQVQLVPCPGKEVPERWLTDPRAVWPAGDEHANTQPASR